MLRKVNRWAYKEGETITIAVVDIIHRPVFYLKHAMDIVHTSLETHYVSATSPKG
jgi:hypothetical protein